MKAKIASLETKRLEIQASLDAAKTQKDRNRLGQFATPTALARDVVARALQLLGPGEPIRFLDPAVGTGAFYSALRAEVPSKRIKAASGYEIDPHYGLPSSDLWKGASLDLQISDFTKEPSSSRFNLLICNPPYVRHHHITADEKARLQVAVAKASHTKIGGLSGLYCYFMGLAHAWQSEGAISAWLIPSEFMDVNYGRTLKHYLLGKVTLLQVHRFDPNDVQFEDALVSSAVVFFRNALPPSNHTVAFTFGGTVVAPREGRSVTAHDLANEQKWTRFPKSPVRVRNEGPVLSDFFKIKRGLATGDNNYFILSQDTIVSRGLPRDVFRPILPGPRYIPSDEIMADAQGIPLIKRQLFLLDPNYSENEIAERFPALHSYLEEGKARRMHEGYLCSHRKPWYKQEKRPAPPILCTYMGRSDLEKVRPFRFILNHSKATVANVYLALYPTAFLEHWTKRDPLLMRRIWELLNNIPAPRLLGEGRVYGGGLHKLEPKELANLPIPEIAQLLPRELIIERQSELFEIAAVAAE